MNPPLEHQPDLGVRLASQCLKLVDAGHGRWAGWGHFGVGGRGPKAYPRQGVWQMALKLKTGAQKSDENRLHLN